MRIFYFKWLIYCYVAAFLGQLLAWPALNYVSYHYGSLYLEPMVGGLVGVMMGVALYLVMRDLVMSFWAWVGWTALAYGVGAFLGAYVTQALYISLPKAWMVMWGTYVPKGLITGLFVGVWVGVVQGLMLSLLDTRRWIVAIVFGFGIGYVLAYAVGNWFMDLPHGMFAFVPGVMGICVGGATLYVFLRSEFGELNG